MASSSQAKSCGHFLSARDFRFGSRVGRPHSLICSSVTAICSKTRSIPYLACETLELLLQRVGSVPPRSVEIPEIINVVGAVIFAACRHRLVSERLAGEAARDHEWHVIE